MTQYNKFNVKLSNSQLNKLKPTIENGTELTLNISSNLIRNYDDETNFPHKLLLTNTQLTFNCLKLYNQEDLHLVHLMNLFHLMYLILLKG